MRVRVEIHRVIFGFCCRIILAHHFVFQHWAMVWLWVCLGSDEIEQKYCIFTEDSVKCFDFKNNLKCHALQQKRAEMW